MAADRRLAFGGVAELYDEARPAYPEPLVSDVLAYAQAKPGDWALEVGAGTGKATLQFADRGLRILALEPSAEMAQVLTTKTAGNDHVTVEQTEFEPWRPNRDFRLLYSAQAWHWVDPARRYDRAAEALGPGGALAVFWNRPRWESCALRGELDEAYTRTAPQLGPEVGPGPMHPVAGPTPQWWSDWRGELEGAAGFTDVQLRTYVWTQSYPTDAYLRLLRTHSDHIVLEDSVREALLSAVAEVIDRHGGVLELEYETTLAVARRVGSTRPSPG